MKINKERVLECMQLYEESITAEDGRGVSTQYLSMELQIQRSNISAILNNLVKEGKVEKVNGRPVLYRLRPQREDYETSCFSSLIGYDQGLKHAVQLAQAAILYPGNILHSLISGPEGSGKSSFAKCMYQYAREKGVLELQAPLVEFNCRDYINEVDRMLFQLFKDPLNNALKRAKNGVLFLEHVEYLNIEAREMLFHMLDNDVQLHDSKSHTIVICALDHHHDEALLDSFRGKFSILIHLPSLASRSRKERLEFIRYFVSLEAIRTKRKISMSAEILRSLLLYECPGNVKQLQKDIQIGCANAYAREYVKSSENLSMQMSDFPVYVRKGFLLYRKYRVEMDALVSDTHTYIFNDQWIQEITTLDHQEYNNRQSIYDVIDQKSEELRNRGIDEYDINRLVSVDIENEFSEYSKQLSDVIVNKEQLSKVVDAKIISLVEGFLDKATQHFDRVYPVSLFYGLCLHLSSTLQNPNKIQRLSNERIMEIADRCKNEYAFCTKFVSKIEQEFQVHLPIDEVIFITMFIGNEFFSEKQSEHVQVLIAMHGKGNATSMAEVVNALVKADNVHAFDLALDMDMQNAYQCLKEEVQELDHGLGILFLYDMGSLKTMAETIMQECDVKISMMELPATLIAIDCARKAANESNLDRLYESVRDSYEHSLDMVKESYQRVYQKQIIITLCMSGKGGAIQMKNYIEKHLSLEDIDVLPYAISDPAFLLNEVNQLRQKSHILCVVSTYDPNLFGIPFVPISQLYETPCENLPHVLLTQPSCRSASEVHYEEIYLFLKEEMEASFVDHMAVLLPTFMKEIQGDAIKLNMDQELGIFLHMATTIQRLSTQEPLLVNPQKKTILSRNKRLYQLIKRSVIKIEQEFKINFHDDEISYLIMSMKKQ